jgi:hypothetical protein
VHASKAKKAADRPHGGDLPKSDQLGQLICFVAITPQKNEFQAAFLRRLGIVGPLAGAVALHAFGEGAR